WAYLEVESSANVTDEVQAYAAGALEAYLTRYLMEAQWENMFAHYCDNQTEYCARLFDFLQKNLEYSYQNEKSLRASDPYWNMVRATSACSGTTRRQRRNPRRHERPYAFPEPCSRLPTPRNAPRCFLIYQLSLRARAAGPAPSPPHAPRVIGLPAACVAWSVRKHGGAVYRSGGAFNLSARFLRATSG
ncbi:hypothetical protein MTO96_045847, partial [Rhipicephalus appendiculatus]